MQIGSLDLPDEVLTALEENRLVIFAGAGVSIPPPADLPGFKRLVEEIVRRPLEQDEVGQMDRVLGRAKERGVPVHRLAAAGLERPGSRFNSLHENLVALFGSRDRIRIVTTNFDRHFEEAINARHGETKVEVFTSPALPVGSSFTGLVHLHGALGRSPETLVLTDADFGRAYLTEGWAGRFLLELFREYTVLFVGYSYGDTVMSYLTRGLSPTFGRQRFALTEMGQREKWELLGIHPIDYDPAGDHRALGDSLNQWVSYERRGFLDWGQRLPALADREPRALAPHERGELEFCLRNPKRARLFYRYAKHRDWLEWAEENGRLQPLFSFDGNQESLWDLAGWFTQEPLGSRGRAALKIALKEVRPIGRALAVVASQQVLSALAAGALVDGLSTQLAAAWATLLIERTAPGAPPYALDLWLDHLSPNDHPQLVIQILAHLLRCQISFHPETFRAVEDDLGLSLQTSILARDFSYRWSEVRNKIDSLAWPLVSVITEILEERWRWLVALEGVTPLSDPWGWSRSCVEPLPGEDDANLEREEGILLDIGKDMLDQLLADAPQKATTMIGQWLSASAPQLIQLGLYGLAKSPKWKPARKIELLIGHLPARTPFKAEAFRVLREAYPRLSRRQRVQFLRRTERLYRNQIDEDQEEQARIRSAFYEWYNVLVWLEQAAPGDELVSRGIAAVRGRYPEFQPRDRPELDIVFGKAQWVRPTSPLKSEEISRISLPEWLVQMEAVSERQRRDFESDVVRGFLEETARAATENLAWGIEFVRGLAENSLFDHEVWPRILTAWSERAFTPDEWSTVLNIIDHPQLLATQERGITEVVRGLAKQREPVATEGMFRSGLSLVEKLLPIAEQEGFSILSENVDWLTQAINHTGGRLAEFLVQATSALLGPKSKGGSEIPAPCKRLLNSIIAGTGRASAMGRVVLASQAHYLHWIDPDWTRASLVPLFDWERNVLQAVQAWHGFLTWGRPNAALLRDLSETVVQLASRLDLLGSERPKYGRFVALAAYSLPDDPLSKLWFEAFVANAGAEDRANFAWELSQLLKKLTPEQKVEIWRGWLDRYLEHRTHFSPAPGGSEFSAFLAWAVDLPKQLGELVERLDDLPGRGAEDDRLLWKIKQGELTGVAPNLLVRLLLAFLKRREKVEPWELTHLRGAIRRLIDDGARGDSVRDLIEKYVEHGGLEHQELLDLLERPEEQ